MKNLLWYAVLSLTIASIGCAMGTPIITPMSNNQYQINLKGGAFQSIETVNEAWKKAAAQKCSNFEVVSQQFTQDYTVDAQVITGVIKCK
ncbi:MAG: hypothetical protein HZC16_04035 [Candidatus Omnitrophica bacterium]|nr:hypothetical protein [Candidatus Omnitrophota bacterium]